ncbi:hypothetical protein KCU93_g295, partial [Aureobasidium melanogenum]
MHSKSPKNEASRIDHNETKPPQPRNPSGGNSHECDATSGLAFLTSAACTLSALLHSFFALWFASSTNNFFSNLSCSSPFSRWASYNRRHASLAPDDNHVAGCQEGRTEAFLLITLRCLLVGVSGFSLSLLHVYMDRYRTLHASSLGLCHESSSVPVSDRYRRTIVFAHPRDHTYELLHMKNKDSTSNNSTVQNVQSDLSRCICKDEQSRAGWLPAAPACVKARLGFLGVSIAKKSFLALYLLPKKLLAVRLWRPFASALLTAPPRLPFSSFVVPASRWPSVWPFVPALAQVLVDERVTKCFGMDDMLAAPDPKHLCVTTGGHNSKAAVVGGFDGSGASRLYVWPLHDRQRAHTITQKTRDLCRVSPAPGWAASATTAGGLGACNKGGFLPLGAGLVEDEEGPHVCSGGDCIEANIQVEQIRVPGTTRSQSTPGYPSAYTLYP